MPPKRGSTSSLVKSLALLNPSLFEPVDMLQKSKFSEMVLLLMFLRKINSSGAISFFYYYFLLTMTFDGDPFHALIFIPSLLS